jgi:hypothetical protein
MLAATYANTAASASPMFSRTAGMSPKNAPATTKAPHQRTAPAAVARRKPVRGISPIPAANGANERTKGTKKAAATARGP